jgi:hypothetical protein
MGIPTARASSWVIVLGCSLTAGCAAFLDYDALTNGRPDGGGGDSRAPDGIAADSSSDATSGETRTGDATAGDAPTEARSTGGTPDASSMQSTSDASVGTGADATRDAPGPAVDATARDASADPCAGVSSLANGAFCGNDGQFGFDAAIADPNTLYTCTDGRTTATVVCVNGCIVRTFMDDSCN